MLQAGYGSKLGDQRIYLQENVSGSWQKDVGPVHTYADGYYAFSAAALRAVAFAAAPLYAAGIYKLSMQS